MTRSSCRENNYACPNLFRCLAAGVSAGLVPGDNQCGSGQSIGTMSRSFRCRLRSAAKPIDTSFEGENESNYLRGGITFTGAYSSNVYSGTTPVSDMSYSIWPTTCAGQDHLPDAPGAELRPGVHLLSAHDLTEPGNQNLAADLQYRLSPNLTASVTEGFQKTSNIFNQPNPLTATQFPAGCRCRISAIVVAVADMMTQFNVLLSSPIRSAPSSMIGGSGNYNP